MHATEWITYNNKTKLELEKVAQSEKIGRENPLELALLKFQSEISYFLFYFNCKSRVWFVEKKIDFKFLIFYE